MIVFFSSRRRHTRFDCDWSSDVCSSDLVAQLGLGDAVRLLGFVSDDALPALYNAADLFVLATRRYDLLVEGFGISIVEASDRKSTRLNSSHSQISYAVFCLKKKKLTCAT